MGGDRERTLVSPFRVGFGGLWCFGRGNTYRNWDGVLFFYGVTGMITLDSFPSRRNVHVFYMRCALSKYPSLIIPNYAMVRFSSGFCLMIEFSLYEDSHYDELGEHGL